MSDFPLTLEEFHTIYSKVPRLTVEIVIQSEEGVLLSLRDIEPFRDQWHLPGGTVYFGERLADAVKRIAKRELSIDVTNSKMLGYIEYPGHYNNRYDSPVGLAFRVQYTGKITLNEEASKVGWFKNIPENMHPDQDKFTESLLRNSGTR